MHTAHFSAITWSRSASSYLSRIDVFSSLSYSANHLSAVRLLTPRFVGGTLLKTARGRFRPDILDVQLELWLYTRNNWPEIVRLPDVNSSTVLCRTYFVHDIGPLFRPRPKTTKTEYEQITNRKQTNHEQKWNKTSHSIEMTGNGTFLAHTMCVYMCREVCVCEHVCACTLAHICTNNTLIF